MGIFFPREKATRSTQKRDSRRVNVSTLPARNQSAIRRAAQVWTSPVYSWRQRSPEWHWTAQWSQHRHHSQSSSSQQWDSVSNPRRHLHSWQNHEPGRLSACTEPAELYRQFDGAGPGEPTCPHGGAPDGCFVDGWAGQCVDQGR